MRQAAVRFSLSLSPSFSRSLSLLILLSTSTCALASVTNVLLPSLQTARQKSSPLRLRGGGNQEDAEIFLKKQGVPANLPALSVIYHSDTGSVPIDDHDEFDTTDMFLQRQPVVDWEESSGKCTLVMLDPDAPTRKGDGSTPGSMGPWLHWLVTDAVEVPEKGKCMVEYMGPAPPRGKHRYIFLLLRQLEASSPVALPSLERPRWDLSSFLALNPHLKPAAYAMYYVDAGA